MTAGQNPVIDNFGRALRLVLKHEGGFVDHPSDPGGATNKGVTQRTYDAWRRAQRLPTRSVRLIEDDEVAAIYRAEYWQKSGAHMLSWPWCYAVFDAAVHSGPARAVRWLRQVLGMPLQPATVTPEVAARATVQGVAGCLRYVELRRDYIERLLAQRPSLQVFARGWRNRLAAVRKVVEGK